MEAEFQTCIHEESSAGRTVLLSSHILAEVEELCDRVSIIRAGRRVETGSLADLRHLTRTTVRSETMRPPSALTGMAGVHDLAIDGNRAAFEVDTAELDTVLGVLRASTIRTLSATPPTLEEMFLRHYGDTLPERSGVET
jgi:ABC-2 type transport system ATP-binding protein